MTCLKNMSFFAARNQVNVSIPLIDAAKDWMRKSIMQNITPVTDLSLYAKNELSINKSIAGYILNFLKEADFNITNINTDEREEPIPEDVRGALLNIDDLPENVKEELKARTSIKQIIANFEHTVENDNGIETYMMSSENGEESRGTLRTFGIETALYNVMNSNSFLAIDEIETSLHPKLLEKILFEYLKSHSKSQILVTTHNDGLLDLVDDLIRKDSVWFTEKEKSGITELYKLTDFKGINRLSSIREAYRNKRFGATMK